MGYLYLFTPKLVLQILKLCRQTHVWLLLNTPGTTLQRIFLSATKLIRSYALTEHQHATDRLTEPYVARVNKADCCRTHSWRIEIKSLSRSRLSRQIWFGEEPLCCDKFDWSLVIGFIRAWSSFLTQRPGKRIYRTPETRVDTEGNAHGTRCIICIDVVMSCGVANNSIGLSAAIGVQNIGNYWRSETWCVISYRPPDRGAEYCTERVRVS